MFKFIQRKQVNPYVYITTKIHILLIAIYVGNFLSGRKMAYLKKAVGEEI